MTTTIVRPKTQVSIAFQWNGQPFSEWPSWLQHCCKVRSCDDGRLALVHTRKSGIQWVYPTEWLVKDLDDVEAGWFTDRQFQATFELVS